MKLLKLGIALDYAVNWNFERILRDLIQNFFDSIGYQTFEQEFEYKYTNAKNKNQYQVLMQTENHPFSYEWLMYVGGSTKTDSVGSYVGMYGEGFKICMLCLLKLNIKDITMHSQDWEIQPCIYDEIVDGVTVKMIGYKYRNVEEDEKTSLIINDVPKSFTKELSEALLHFFYYGNPLFGDKIAETKEYAIFKSSRMKIPCEDYMPDFKGILYYNFLARGRLPFPIFVLLKNTSSVYVSRQRKVLPDYEIPEILYDLCKLFDADVSYEMLLMLEKYWDDLPSNMYDWKTNYYFICQLVRNVSKSEVYSKRFKENYNKLVYIERLGSDKVQNKLIRETKYWASTNNTKLLVNPIFRFLGAESLVSKYQVEQTKDYSIPTKYQQKKIELLFQLVDKIIPYKLYEDRPEVLINYCEGRVIEPLQFSIRNFKRNKTEKYCKYKITKLILDSKDLESESFDNTFIKFVDILLHTYGSSRNNKMNLMLTA